jgi:hypothetical protein
MQGNSNILTFSDMINANSTYPLRVYVYLPESQVKDDLGEMRVKAFTLDYDIDPFRSSVGTASETNVAPTVTGTSDGQSASVSGSSANQTATVSGSSANQSAGVSGTSDISGASESGYYFGSYLDNITSDLDGTWNEAGTTVNIGSYDYLFHGVFVSFGLIGDGSTNFSLTCDLYIRVYNSVEGEYFPDSSGIRVLRIFDMDENVSNAVTPSMYIHIPYSWRSGKCKLQFKSANIASYLSRGDMNYAYHGSRGHSHDDGTFSANSHAHSDGTYSADSHAHSDGTYSADSHSHGDGTYGAASHNHSVSIGDDVEDSASLNATQLSEIKLYHYNTSTTNWDLKHTITNTGKTLDIDLDISDGGTYPDEAGSWKVEIKTDNATPDLVQAVVKCKHELNN